MSKTKRVTVAEYLNRQIELNGISQKDIAAALGYTNPNVITMFKQGRTKLPMTKVGPMAKVLGVDPVHLLEIVMNEYMPETWEALEELVGKSLVTEGEMRLVRICRENSGGHDLMFERAEHQTLIAKAIREVAEDEFPSKTRTVATKK